MEEGTGALSGGEQRRQTVRNEGGGGIGEWQAGCL